MVKKTDRDVYKILRSEVTTQQQMFLITSKAQQ